MTFPNPAKYFLPMPKQFEKEIELLPKNKLTWLISSLADYIHQEIFDEGCSLNCVTSAFDDYATELSEVDLIQLLRYLTERLAYLAN